MREEGRDGGDSESADSESGRGRVSEKAVFPQLAASLAGQPASPGTAPQRFGSEGCWVPPPLRH